MKALNELIDRNSRIRVIGFDDAPFDMDNDRRVNISGVVCSGSRFEGMLWGEVEKDGDNATDILVRMVLASKFYEQIHMVLMDGLAFGGFNLIDLPRLTRSLDRPCVAVMRKPPDMPAIKRALTRFDDYEKRFHLISTAGEIHDAGNIYFQVIDEDPAVIGKALKMVSDQGNVPEALRLAHMIGAAVVLGQSGKRA